MIKALLREIEFVAGLKIELLDDSILVVIGPNNVGKSATLKDIHRLIAGDAIIGTVVKSIALDRISNLTQVYEQFEAGREANDRYNLSNQSFAKGNLESWWEADGPSVGTFLTKFLVSNLDTRSRLADCDPPNSFDALKPFGAEHPFQRMYADETLEEKSSKAVRRAFRCDLVIHRAAGRTIPAFIGAKPTLRAGEDRISRSYLDRIESLERLDAQGDGIRSFVSIVGRVITEERSIQLIDEPEAFLHPPQAKLVAQIIASEASDRQTLIATHSSDVLQGLLRYESQRVSVVRLARSIVGGRANFLPGDAIAALWRDPILRFGKVLDGLFHDGVIVAEADGDCRFYEAISAASVPSEHSVDIHYTYSGGKDRVPILVRALACLNVPVATIVDFDVLNNEHPLRPIVEAHGGDWSQVEPYWLVLKEAVEAKSAFIGGDRFRGEMKTLLASIPPGESVPKDVLKKVRSLARNASPWDHVKDTGVDAVTRGEPKQAALRLLALLKTIGIFIAPKGQMESFCPTIGSKGARWVEEALRRDLKTDPELADARKFTFEVQTFLRQSVL